MRSIKLERVHSSYLKMIIEDGGANAATTEPLLELAMIGTIEAVSELLRREHLEDNLDTRVAWAEGISQQHHGLRGIIRHACQTRSFSHIADLDIFYKPQAHASDLRARSNQDEDRLDFLYDPDADSEDINCVLQMFIFDKAGKNCNEQSLGRITRNHDSIQCLSNLPYIAPPLELNVKSKLHATFPTKMPNRSETDRCLRIDASGINDTTSLSWANIPRLRVICMGLSLGKKKHRPKQLSKLSSNLVVLPGYAICSGKHKMHDNSTQLEL